MQKDDAIRIVIDTNLWISFLISRKLVRLDKLLLKNNVLLLFSEELLDEIKAAIVKPKLRKYFGDADNALEEMLLIFQSFIEFVIVKSNVEVCRDKFDNFLLSLAKDGNAHFLITGDKDLLVLREFEKTKIVAISEFENDAI